MKVLRLIGSGLLFIVTMPLFLILMAVEGLARARVASSVMTLGQRLDHGFWYCPRERAGHSCDGAPGRCGWGL